MTEYGAIVMVRYIPLNMHATFVLCFDLSDYDTDSRVHVICSSI